MNRTAASALAALVLLSTACATADDATIDPADTQSVTSPDTVVPAADPAAAGGLLNPDSASREQLAAIPGMTPALADSLVARRPIESMLTVDSILARSLDETQRDTVYARLFKPLALNTASDTEILLIPGIGNRMLHEFKEYRPYDTMARFRREIGKYVDSTEVARLERFIRIE